MTSDQDFAATIVAIRTGDLGALRRILADDSSIAASRLGGLAKGRTPLHILTDWPGYFTNGAQVVRMLIDAGANVDARSADDEHGETPLHWAASSDDADVAAVLIEAGADVEISDGSIGTPLDNAVGYACWNVARLLVAQGARVDKLWHASALGMLERTEELLSTPESTPDQISQACWHACAAGHRRTAELLLDHGADLDWQPDYGNGTALDAAMQHGTQQDNVIEWLIARGARATKTAP